MAFSLKLTVSPIPVDPDPNVSVPSQDRVFLSEQRQALTTAPGRQLAALLSDGMSLDCTLWGRFAEGSAWIRLAGPLTVLPFALKLLGTAPPDVELFVQLTNAVANPSSISFAFV